MDMSNATQIYKCGVILFTFISLHNDQAVAYGNWSNGNRILRF